MEAGLLGTMFGLRGVRLRKKVLQLGSVGPRVWECRV